VAGVSLSSVQYTSRRHARVQQAGQGIGTALELSIREITAADAEGTYDAFLSQVPLAAPTQASPWASVIESEPGAKARRLLLEDSGTTVAAALLAVQAYARNRCGIVCAGGPVLSEPDAVDVWEAALKALVGYAKAQKALFLHLQPYARFSEELALVFKSQRILPHERDMPEGGTRWIDLDPDPEELLKQMHSSARRDARSCVRKGAEIEQGTDEALVGPLWDLHARAYEAKGLEPMSKERLTAIIRAGAGSVHVARWEGIPVSAILVLHHDGLANAIWLCGGTNREVKGVPAGPFVHWHAMQWLREQGFRTYDLGGIGLGDRPRGELESIDAFKRRLGGYDVCIFGGQRWTRLPIWILRVCSAAQGVLKRFAR
jgi:peptidoglycan pentaglycine glycine transferase (the first glycine)